MGLKKIYTVSGATALKISPPVHPDAPNTIYPTPQRLYMFAEAGAWRFRLGDFSVLGSEIVSNGALASATDWTIGTGGAIAAGAATWDGSQTGNSDLTQDTDDTGASLVEGELYTVSIVVSGRTAGGVTPILGGTAGTQRTADDTYVENILAGADGLIIIRADVDFDGSVDDISVKRAIIVHDTSPPSAPNGTGSWNIKEQTYKDIEAPSEITVVGEDSNAILTYYWE